MDPHGDLASSRPPDGPLASYGRAVRAHPALVALAILAALGGGLAWLATRDNQYRATAHLLIDPASSDDEVLLGLPLIRDAGDPTRTAQTAAALLESPRAAADTAEALGAGATTQSVLHAVTVEPAGQSNILAVTAAGGTAAGAARLANTFAGAALADRDAQLVAAVDAALAAPPGAGADGTAGRAARLAALRSGDPTVSRADEAVAPLAPVGAPWWLVLALALGAGAVLGGIAAIVAELRSPQRVADEEELLEHMPLPVLARLPHGWQRFPGEPGALYPTAAEVAFRSLQVQLGLLDGSCRAVMVSSPGDGDGKSTLLTSLAFRLAAEGEPVVVLDLDLHAPRAADLLGVASGRGLAQLLETGGSLAGAIVAVTGVEDLWVLPGMQDTRLAALAAVRDRLPGLLSEAESAGCHVLIDTAPLGTVGDALLLLAGVDELLLVVRTGHTALAAVEGTRDALRRAGRAPSGFAVIGEMGPPPVIRRPPLTPRSAPAGRGTRVAGGALWEFEEETKPGTVDRP